MHEVVPGGRPQGAGVPVMSGKRSVTVRCGGTSWGALAGTRPAGHAVSGGWSAAKAVSPLSGCNPEPGTRGPDQLGQLVLTCDAPEEPSPMEIGRSARCPPGQRIGVMKRHDWWPPGERSRDRPSRRWADGVIRPRPVSVVLPMQTDRGLAFSAPCPHGRHLVREMPASATWRRPSRSRTS